MSSSDHSPNFVGGSVFIENGSDEIPSIISLVYAVNFGNEIRSFVHIMPLNCPAMRSASSFPNVNAIVVPTLPKIASLISGISCEVY